jgi:hypothetical protein
MSLPFDALHLARAQFAFTMSFHFIFPAFSIGLASYLMVLEGLWLKTRDSVYLDLFKYWLKIFAVAFGMGVVSGIVISYQFGTNWSGYSNKAGPSSGRSWPTRYSPPTPAGPTGCSAARWARTDITDASAAGSSVEAPRLAGAHLVGQRARPRVGVAHH